MNPGFLNLHLQENPLVITGMGVCTAAGATVAALWESACQGVPSGAWLPMPLPWGRGLMAGCSVREIPLDAHDLRTIRRADRCVQLGVAAARQAWLQAGLADRRWASDRISITAGTSRGPVEKWTESTDRLAKGRVLPTLAANSTIASLSGALSLVFQAQGPCFTVSSACASAASAIALGAQQIVTGSADIALVGGAEAPLNPNVLAQLAAAGVIGSHEDPRLACRPFDINRNGTVLGEGAGFLVLETLATARQRGATVLARLAGWATGSEGTERTGMAENGEGLHRVMRSALELANLPPDAIGYVNAHGTGTVLNDRMEGAALSRVFGGRRERIPCSSTKPVTGHCMGATAAIEAVICIEALRHQTMPPTAACQQPEAFAALDFIREGARGAELETVISNSSGFWGNHASLLFALPPRS